MEVSGDRDAVVGLQAGPENPRFFNFNSGQAKLILDPSSNNSTSATGLNYDSVNYFDGVFQVVNQGTDPLDMEITSDGIGSKEGSVDNPVELYTGSADSSSGSTIQDNGSLSELSLLSAQNPLSIGVGDTVPIGVKVELGPQGENNLDGGQIQLRAEKQDFSQTNLSGDDRGITISNTDFTGPNADSGPAFTGDSDERTYKLSFDYTDPQEQDLADADVITVGFPDTNSSNAGFSSDANNYAVNKASNGGTQNLNDAGEINDGDGRDGAGTVGELIDQLSNNDDVAFIEVQSPLSQQSSTINVKLDQVTPTSTGMDDGDRIVVGLHQLNGSGKIKASFASALANITADT